MALVGEPVFRLAQLLTSSANTETAPQVYRAPNIDEYVASCQVVAGVSNQPTAQRVMCLHLPSDSAQPEMLLGAAGRACPRLVLVEHVTSASDATLLGDEHFFALGYKRLADVTDSTDIQRSWYAYSLSDYKQAPDWLNARFWANPERFDLAD